MSPSALKVGFCCLAIVWLGPASFAHNVSSSNADFLAGVNQAEVGLFVYLGAKHMVTGYDHLLYLFGIVFSLRHLRDALLYVSLFAMGHSISLVAGASGGWQVNANLVDAVIGASVVYKGLENTGGLKALFGMQPHMPTAVFLFGLVHGLGLATKLQAVYADGDGFIVNLISFNLGVELGQLAALTVLMGGLICMPRIGLRNRSNWVNWILMSCGCLFVIHHLTQFSLGSA